MSFLLFYQGVLQQYDILSTFNYHFCLSTYCNSTNSDRIFQHSGPPPDPSQLLPSWVRYSAAQWVNRGFGVKTAYTKVTYFVICCRIIHLIKYGQRERYNLYGQIQSRTSRKIKGRREKKAEKDRRKERKLEE